MYRIIHGGWVWYCSDGNDDVLNNRRARPKTEQAEAVMAIHSLQNSARPRRPRPSDRGRGIRCWAVQIFECAQLFNGPARCSAAANYKAWTNSTKRGVSQTARPVGRSADGRQSKRLVCNWKRHRAKLAQINTTGNAYLIDRR